MNPCQVAHCTVLAPTVHVESIDVWMCRYHHAWYTNTPIRMDLTYHRKRYGADIRLMAGGNWDVQQRYLALVSDKRETVG